MGNCILTRPNTPMYPTLDTTDIITEWSNFTGGAFSYTAPRRCWFVAHRLYGAGIFNLNGKPIYQKVNDGSTNGAFKILLNTGDKITTNSSYNGIDGYVCGIRLVNL